MKTLKIKNITNYRLNITDKYAARYIKSKLDLHIKSDTFTKNSNNIRGNK